jgi:Flp pilus assembly protein TadG
MSLRRRQFTTVRTSLASSRHRRGAAMFETALLLSAWLILLLGTLDLGMILFRHTIMQQIATKAVRLAMIRGANSTPQIASWGPVTVQVSLNQSQAVANLLRASTAGLDPAAFQVRMEWPDGGNQRDQRVMATVTSAQPTVLQSLLPGNGSFSMTSTALTRIVQ